MSIFYVTIKNNINRKSSRLLISRPTKLAMTPTNVNAFLIQPALKISTTKSFKRKNITKLRKNGRTFASTTYKISSECVDNFILFYTVYKYDSMK